MKLASELSFAYLAQERARRSRPAPKSDEKAVLARIAINTRKAMGQDPQPGSLEVPSLHGEGHYTRAGFARSGCAGISDSPLPELCCWPVSSARTTDVNYGNETHGFHEPEDSVDGHML